MLMRPHGPLLTLSATSAGKSDCPYTLPRYSDMLPAEHVPAPGWSKVPVTGASTIGRMLMRPSVLLALEIGVAMGIAVRSPLAVGNAAMVSLPAG